MLARIAPVSRATAAFGMIAGAAAGVVSIANDLGADDRMVAVMQYLRVVMILLLTPILAALFFDSGHAAAGFTGAAPVGFLDNLGYIVVAGGIGYPLARLLRFSSPNFFGPVFVGAVMMITHMPFAGPGPRLVPYIAYAIIGGKVGLEFTAESLRQARKILPATLAMITLMIVLCGLLGVAMAKFADVTPLDGFLATTPGVIQVVLATAIGMHANTTFVLSTQVLRLIMMLVAAPAVAKRLMPLRCPQASRRRCASAQIPFSRARPRGRTHTPAETCRGKHR